MYESKPVPVDEAWSPWAFPHLQAGMLGPESVNILKTLPVYNQV